MELRLLGPLEVWGDAGDLIPVPSLQQRRLLAVLGLAAGRPVNPDAVIDALWGDDPPNTARQAVQVYVSSLRKRLGAGTIATLAGGYRFAAGRVQLDVERFAALAAQPPPDSEVPEASAERLRAGLALWRGPALADFRDDAFAQTEIARLEESRAAAVEAWMQARLDAGESSALVADLQALVVEYPLRERFVQLLIRALYRAGRQADALSAYRTARTVLRDQLGLEPSVELQQLHRAVLAQDVRLVNAPTPRPPAPARLPAFPTPLVGRATELAEICGLLAERAVRVVSLLGPGGVGKTRLAVAAAGRLAEDLRGAVVFVDLAAISDPGRVPAAVATMLGVQLSASADPAATIGEALRGRRLLLLLDNFEQVLGAAGFVASLIEDAPGLSVLVTSRRPLRIPAERRLLVAPLGVDAATDATAGSASAAGGSPAEPASDTPLPDAVALFLQCARHDQPTLAWDAGAVATARRICTRLDGLPLAIEIAAARLSALTVAQLGNLVEGPGAELTTPGRDGPGRHASLWETVDWSYRLLPDDAARVFRHLAAFPTGADPDAIAAVVGLAPELLPDALQLLVDSSLIRRAPAADEVRFGMLHVIREYARHQLEAAQEAAGALDRHAAHYAVTIARPVAEAGPYRQYPRTPSEGTRWRREQENLWQAVETSRSTDRLDLLVPLGLTLSQPWWSAPTRPLELLEFLLARPEVADLDRLDLLLMWAVSLMDSGAPERAEHPLAEAVVRAGALRDDARLSKAHALRAYTAGVAGDDQASLAEQRLAVAAARRSGDAEALSAALAMAGAAHSPEDDPRWSLNRLGEAFQLARRSDNRALIELVLVNLSEAALAAGEAEAARQWAAEAAQAALLIGYRLGHTYAIGNLAAALLLIGDRGQAEEALRIAITSAWDLRESRATLEFLLWQACLRASQGRPGQAAALLGAYDANLQAHNGASSPVELRMRRTLLADIDRDLAGAWAVEALRGSLWTLEDCVNWALAEEPSDLSAAPFR